MAGVLVCTGPSFAATPMPCTSLNGINLPLDGVATTLSVTAVDMKAGSISEHPPSPSFCAVTATVSSNGAQDQSQISIVVWLPRTRWNGRFLGTGNGGFGGAVDQGALRYGLLQGYAVASTDLGTGNLFKCLPDFCGSLEGYRQYDVPLGGLFGDAAAVTDFGYGATHLMTLAGQQLIQVYYRTSAQFSYFHGCSTGGAQALTEAQRYPLDYDGILAGSPAYARTSLINGRAELFLATHFAADAFLTSGARRLAHAGVLKACAGRDGGLPSDDYLTQPAMCAFDAATLRCSGTQGEIPCTDSSLAAACTCLNAHQANAIDMFWNGALDDHGRTVDPGYERGAEDAQPPTGFGTPTDPSEPGDDSLDYWVFGPKFRWKSLFASDHEPAPVRAARLRALDAAPIGSEKFSEVVDARKANLSAFNANGGKIILYAGYGDPSIPSADTIDYYNQAVTDNAQTAEFSRLYLAPGMWHCGGGPGVNAFGNMSGEAPPRPGSPADDIMTAMVAWRETGHAPERIVATHYISNDPAQGIAFQRPLCPYPRNAGYDGTGNPLLAGSYVCAQGSPVQNQGFGSGYGPK